MRAGGHIERRRAAIAAAIAVVAMVLLAAPTPAKAADPGRWVETGHSAVPLDYFQGVTSGPRKSLWFDGFFSGLYRTDFELTELARAPNVIPLAVLQTEGYNHIGDITWDRREGGRVLLPLECFFTGCRTGAIGVADPETLEWRYYVKLDPAFIDKAMWAETSPDGKLLWTSSGSGNDLLAYDMDEITAANAGPGGPALKPVRHLVGAVPPSTITGATFYKGRLLVAGQRTGPFQVWSIDTADGSRRLEIEREIVGESEGLDIVKARGGILHWLIVPFQTRGMPPTYGEGHSTLVHFVPVKGGVGPQR